MGGVLNRFRTPLLWLAGAAFFAALAVIWMVVCYEIAFVPVADPHARTGRATISYLLGAGFPYHISLPALFLGFAVFYLIFPLLFGASANARLVHIQFWMTGLGGALILGPIVGLKLFGLPQSGVDDERLFAICNGATWIGYVVVWLGTLVVIFVVFDALRRRHRAAESASET
jgi:cytochrome c oxidase subunit 1